MAENHKDKPSPVPVQPVVAGSWQQVALRWLFEQGFSSVLLVGILVASYMGIPKVLIPTINEGYKQNAAALQKSAETYTESNEKIATLIMKNAELYMKNAESEREALRQAVQAIDKNK